MSRYHYRKVQAPLHAFLAEASLRQRTPQLRDWTVHATHAGNTVIAGVDHRSILLAPAFLQALAQRCTLN